jgi:MFS family permease
MLMQTPMGFATDRFGARTVLLAGVAVGSASLLLLAAYPAYLCLLFTSVLAGAANGVYHPADYTILSRVIPEAKMGRAFSVHSFAGFLGSAITPGTLTAIAAFYGARSAVAAAGLLGAGTLLMLLCSRKAPEEGGTRKAPALPSAGRTRTAQLFTLPVMMMTLIFVLLNLSSSAIDKFSVSALLQGYNLDLPLANAAVTAFLFCSALGVLGGGFLADRTKRHGFVAAAAFAVAALLAAAVAAYNLPPAPLVLIFSMMGVLTGIIVPSRDLLVRAVTPPGSEGKVFGVVFTGFNIGGTLGPLLFAYLLDSAMARAVFWFAVLFMALTALAAWMQELKLSRSGPQKAPHE